MVKEVAAKKQVDASFEYRFNRDNDKNEDATKVRNELIKAVLKNQLGYEKFLELVTIRLYPVSRVGNSGSAVFYMDCYFTNATKPAKFVAKFQSILLTNLEAKAARDAEAAALCSSINHKTHEKHDIGVVVYKLAGLEDASEFRDLLRDKSVSDEDCVKALSCALAKVGDIKNHAPKKRISFLTDFNWYLGKRSNKPIGKLHSLSKKSNLHNDLVKLATSINKSYELLKVKLKDIEVIPVLVHGDLHARNLMVNKDKPQQVEFIDFGWTHFGHPAKDYVIMENTLKYMLLREIISDSWKINRTKNDSHLALGIFAEFEIFLCKHGLNLPEFISFRKHLKNCYKEKIPVSQMQALKRVYVCIQEIRSCSSSILGKYVNLIDSIGVKSKPKLDANEHYFASLFLTALGVISFTEIELLWALTGLKLIGDKLIK